MTLAGAVALVTGGAGGIGSASCRALARAGAHVVVADLDEARAQAVAKEVDGLAARLDLSDEEQVIELMSRIDRTYGRLDIVHSNAAMTDADVLARDTTVTEVDLDVWEQVFAGNLTTHVLVCKHAIPLMVRGGGGSIITMSSGAAAVAEDTRVAYAASKAGVEALTRSIATSYGKQGIRANVIVPGLILTAPVLAQVPAGALDRLSQGTSTPYVGAPDDIAEVVVFLAGPGARYMTGQRIPVDGGASTRGSHVGRET